MTKTKKPRIVLSDEEWELIHEGIESCVHFMLGSGSWEERDDIVRDYRKILTKISKRIEKLQPGIIEFVVRDRGLIPGYYECVVKEAGVVGNAVKVSLSKPNAKEAAR